MKHYLFWIDDEDSPDDGYEFLVGAYSFEEAKRIAVCEFAPYCLDWEEDPLTEWEAENSGLDEF